MTGHDCADSVDAVAVPALDPHLSQRDAEQGVEPSPDVPRPSTLRVVTLAGVMLLTYFLGTVSNQAVTLAIPVMARDYGTSELEVQWVVSAYGLAYGCGLLFCGRVADLYGRKFCYLGGLVVFLIFNILSAVVKPQVGLFVMRAFAGLGLALACPAGFGLIGETITHEPERSIVFAAFGLGGPIGASSGTILGGGVAGINQYRAWSYLFYILAALTLIPLIVGWFAFPGALFHTGGSVAPRLDWLGGFLVTAAISLFMFSMVQSGIVSTGWRTPYVPALLIVSIILFVLFLCWERYLERRNGSIPPAAKFSLFTRNRYRFTFVLLASFFAFMGAAGWVYCATIFYQNVKGDSALMNAVHLLPCNLLGIVAGFIVMYLSTRVRAPILIMGSTIITGVSSVIYAVASPDVSYWATGFVAQLLLPWGIDFTMCIGNVLAANLVREDERSVGGAVFQTSYTIGGSLGTALSSLVISERTNVTGSILSGTRSAFWMNAAATWFVSVIVLIGLRRLGIAKDAGREEHEEDVSPDVVHPSLDGKGEPESVVLANAESAAGTRGDNL
ncbi:hypothetical protein EHS25_007256 [Saitozyma podzolica]|uniref:Major facilitator superfamily (MFS) profile domain-containing protein n=1 Tax=Saitozyma podzolica TaxID=1890683 RepID=A0A427XMM3_9TREE|nr:hypothetical protein EHS25_007256 [Saitozyma podzolica]